MKPPLELAVEVTDASGSRYRWGSEKGAGDIPQGLRFGTRQGDGFADASVTLARRIDQEFVDLGLLNDIAFIGADGSVAYEGRVAAMPRSLADTHSITVSCAGWMSHAADRKFTEIYVDRDLSGWVPVSRARRVALIQTSAKGVIDPVQDLDVAGGLPAIRTIVDGEWLAAKPPWCEAHYDAGPGHAIAAIYYNWQRLSNTTSTGWEWEVGVADDDILTNFAGSGELQNEPNATGSGYFTPATGRRFGSLRFAWAGAGGNTEPNTEYGAWWRTPAVYGNHGLTRRGSDPGGFYASDVVKNIVSRFCPKLNTSGVQDTTFVIPHLVFRERTTPYDALLELNKYHQWRLEVYENKTLYFRPHDLSDHDWEVRLSDPGVTVELQGDSTQELANGIVVEFQDVLTGTKTILTPDTNTELADTSVSNPANAHGIKLWTEVVLSSPTTTAAALQFGRIALAEFNAPKAPGTITIRGHVRDRAGHWAQAWKMRAGQTLVISDHPNDAVRLISETSYDHSSQTVSVSVDNTARRLDAVIDRMSTALAASNLQT